MDALLTINAKRNEHQPEKKSAEKHTKPARRSEPKQTVARQQVTEPNQAPVEHPEADSSVAEAEEAHQAVVEEQTLFSQVEVVTDGETETVDSDTQLIELVEALEISVDENDSEQAVDVNLVQPAVSLPVQTAETVVSPQVVEQVVVAAIEPQQQVVVATQNRIAVPQEQQLVGATVAALETDSAVVLSVEQTIATPMTEEVVEQAVDAGEKVDPRFAALLKPRAEKPVTQPLREACTVPRWRVSRLKR